MASSPHLAGTAEGGSIELHLGRDLLHFARGTVELPWQSLRLDDGARHTLEPGAVALWSTDEYVAMPNGMNGYISTVSSLARIGVISAAATHVEPGFAGRLSLELVNMGHVPVALRARQAVAHLTTVPVQSVSTEHSGAQAMPDEAHLVLSFGDNEVNLVAQVRMGQAVQVSRSIDFDILNLISFSASSLLPALHEFRELVSTSGVPEAEVQRFLELYPEFLTGFDYVEAIPQIVIELDSGARRIPDFVLRPTGADLCDLVEIKRPDARVVTRVAGRPVLSRTAAAGVAQLLEYSEAVRSVSVQERIRGRYGLELAFPRLQLVVGRIHGTSVRAIRRAAQTTGVDVRTYDNLLDRAQFRLQPGRSRRD